MPELWDIYDKNRQKTGMTHQRGVPLNAGEYHIVVQAFIRNEAGEILVSRRHPDKGWGGYWETTGGSVVAGEDSLTGILREVREELGVILLPENGRLLATLPRVQENGGGTFYDIWSFAVSGHPPLTLQPEEVTEAKWVSREDYMALRKNGLFVPAIPEVFALESIIGR